MDLDRPSALVVDAAAPGDRRITIDVPPLRDTAGERVDTPIGPDAAVDTEVEAGELGEVGQSADVAETMDERPPLPPDAAVDTSAGLQQGQSCSTGGACASGKCVDGVCCNTACDQACQACNRPGTPGVCGPEPAGAICGAASCRDGTARVESRCDQASACVPGAATSCGPYACDGNLCRTSCTAERDCASPFSCGATVNACLSTGLLIHWPFDEPTGTTALDASGFGRNASGIGEGSRPQPSTVVPTLKFPNPRSREFIGLADQGFVAAPVPASIKANPELTLAAWFRATTTEVEGSAIVNIGPDFSLRIKPDKVEWVKRRGTQPGSLFAYVAWPSTAGIDGAWHHVAGTSGATGMVLFVDGVPVGSTGNNDPPVFTLPDQVAVGHEPGDDSHEHTGHIDDVRVYGRVLAPSEIKNLAAGNR